MKQNISEFKPCHNHFSFHEREILTIEYALGTSQKDIASMLNRSPSTICRELKRNKSSAYNSYFASQAQIRSNFRKKNSHAKQRLKNIIIQNYVIQKLKTGWTPEQIAGKIQIDIPGAKTNYESIYLYIYNENRDLIKYLPRGHRIRQKRYQKQGKRRHKLKDRVFIDKRPEVINERKRIGDWEADTVVSRKSKEILVVLRERKSQFTLITKSPNKTAKEMQKAVLRMLRDIDKSKMFSITLDNGTENALHKEIAKILDIKIYFCNPYHSWEKGSVENTIGLIRRYFPKKTDFSLISNEDIKRVQHKLNNRPRKKLEYATPIEYLKNCA